MKVSPSTTASEAGLGADILEVILDVISTTGNCVSLLVSIHSNGQYHNLQTSAGGLPYWKGACRLAGRSLASSGINKNWLCVVMLKGRWS